MSECGAGGPPSMSLLGRGQRYFQPQSKPPVHTGGFD